jgi:hypothetical protein
VNARAEPATLAAPAACYVYGVVLSSARVVGPPDQVALVPYGRVGALVRAARPLPARRSLTLHAEVLDRTAAVGPVLPMRFGTVVASPRVLEEEVLAPYQEEYAAALEALTGRAQFTVRARYLADQILREVLAEEPEVLLMHAELRRRGADQAGRVRLGELVARAVAARRDADTAVLTETLRAHTVSAKAHLPNGDGPDRIADLACLVEVARSTQLESAAERLGRLWRDRARLTLLGPMAAYDFAGELTTAQVGR